MKILLNVPYFYPAWSYGGPAKLAFDLAKSLVEKGHRVIVYTSDAYDANQRMPKKLRIKSTKKLQIHYFSNFSNYFAYYFHLFLTPTSWWRMFWEIPTCDVVHLHDFFTPQNFLISWWCWFWHIPYLVNPHGTLESKTLQQKRSLKLLLMKLVGLKMLNHAALVVASSDQEITNFQNLGIANEKIFFLGHGIDLTELDCQLTKNQAQKKLSLPTNKVVVTYLGRISRLKGLDMLLEVIKQTQSYPVHFVIAGSDSGYLSKIEEWIKTNKPKNITLKGVCAGQEKAELYQASDIFIYPSYSEGFSLGILEAAGTGLPLIITQGCHFDLVEQKNAGIVTRINAADLTKAVIKLSSDRKLREKMGKNAKQLITAEFSQSKITQQLTTAYEQTVANSN